MRKMTDPLADPDELPKMKRTYDALCEAAEHFKIRDYARKFPHMHKWYVEQGRIGEDELL